MKIRLAALGIICTILMISCANPKQLEYRDVQNIQVKELSLKPKVGMDILLFNPNEKGVTLKDADLKLYINDKHVGDATLAEKSKVPGMDTFAVPVILDADLSGIFGNAFSLLSNKEVNIRVQGTIKAGKIGIPIPINYTGRKKLNVLEFEKR